MKWLLWIIIPGFIITWIILGFISFILVSKVTKEGWREVLIDNDGTWLAFVALWPVLDILLIIYGIGHLLWLVLVKIAKLNH